MTTNHIDQLAEWWENAEEGVIERGDTVINRSDGETTVYVATVRARRQHPSARILSRAPKPKPAWHDAPAVIAETTLHYRRVWVREGDGTYSNTEGEMADDYELHDVTPLIEAKVTDEMVDRILDVIGARFDNYPAGIGEALAVAALGLETT